MREFELIKQGTRQLLVSNRWHNPDLHFALNRWVQTNSNVVEPQLFEGTFELNLVRCNRKTKPFESGRDFCLPNAPV